MKKFFFFLALCLLSFSAMQAETIVYDHCPVTTDEEEYPNFKAAELVQQKDFEGENILTLMLYYNPDFYWDVESNGIYRDDGNGKYLMINFAYEDLYDLTGVYSNENGNVYTPEYAWFVQYEKMSFPIDSVSLNIEWSEDHQSYKIYYWFKCYSGTPNEIVQEEWVYGICPILPPPSEIYGEFGDEGETFTLYYGYDIPYDAIRMDVEYLPWFGIDRYDLYVEERQGVKTIALDKSMEDARPIRTDYWFSGFENATKVKNLVRLNTENTFTMTAMFQDCKSLTSLDLSHFETGKCEKVPSMFENCEKLEKIDLSHFNTAKVENTYSMFANCKALTELDMRNCDWSNVTYAKLMFDKCENLETIYSSQDLSQNSELDGENMFRGCTKLKGGNGTQCDGELYVDSEYARPDQPGQPGYFTEQTEGMKQVQSQEPSVESRKMIVNGQLLIERNGKTFNALGAEMR